MPNLVYYGQFFGEYNSDSFESHTIYQSYHIAQSYKRSTTINYDHNVFTV